MWKEHKLRYTGQIGIPKYPIEIQKKKIGGIGGKNKSSYCLNYIQQNTCIAMNENTYIYMYV